VKKKGMVIWVLGKYYNGGMLETETVISFPGQAGGGAFK